MCYTATAHEGTAFPGFASLPQDSHCSELLKPLEALFQSDPCVPCTDLSPPYGTATLGVGPTLKANSFGKPAQMR